MFLQVQRYFTRAFFWSEPKPSFPIALICTARRRIPASATTNQGPEKAIWSLSMGMRMYLQVQRYFTRAFFWSEPHLYRSRANSAHRRQSKSEFGT